MTLPVPETWFIVYCSVVIGIHKSNYGDSGFTFYKLWNAPHTWWNGVQKKRQLFWMQFFETIWNVGRLTNKMQFLYKLSNKAITKTHSWCQIYSLSKLKNSSEKGGNMLKKCSWLCLTGLTWIQSHFIVTQVLIFLLNGILCKWFKNLCLPRLPELFIAFVSTAVYCGK